MKWSIGAQSEVRLARSGNKYKMRARTLEASPSIIVISAYMMRTCRTLIMSREIKDPGLSIKCVDKGCVDIKYVRCTLSPNSAINKFRPFDTLSSTAVPIFLNLKMLL